MDLSLNARLPPRLAAALVAAALLALGLSAVASAAPHRDTAVGAIMRIGPAPVIPAGASAQGALPRSSLIHATVALEPRDPGALAAYARAVSTPGSPVYRHYLSVAQFAHRFAPDASQVAAVRAALQAHGLHPGPVAVNGLSFDVTAPVATVSTAFATSFERYRVAGRTAFANTSAPALPASVAGLVQGVVGLDSLAVPTPAGLARSRPARPRAANAARRTAVAPGATKDCSPGAGGLTAGQIAAAYGLTDLYAAGDGGAGATVALFELEPYSAADIAAYQSCYGTTTSVTNINIDGGPGSGSGQGEAALDIEDLIGLAPHASILVYQGDNTGTGALRTYQAMITQHRAQVISTSWGLCEPTTGSLTADVENVLFQEAAVQGQTIVAASGDHGAQDCTSGTWSGRPTVDDPASQPYVTGVGGTSLTSVGPPPTETVWNSTWSTGGGHLASGAGGGGVSRFWGQPSYQAGIALPQSATTCGGSTACREVPDVSADADILTGYDVYYQGHWSIFAGTSAAAPTWAALATLADASVACTGKTVGFANPALYQAASTGYGIYYNDVTSGTNSYGGVGGFGAGPGYDMVAGLGSPKGGPLAAVLCGSTWSPPATTATISTPPSTPPSTPVVTLTRPATQRARVGQSVRVALRAADSAGYALTYRATGLPAGLALAQTTGLITGTPTRAGRSTATVTVTDTSGSGAKGTVAWNIAGRPTITGRLTVNAKGRPSLSLRVGAGKNAPAIQSIVVAPSSQIRFSRRTRDLSRGITVRNGSGHRLRSKARVRGGDLIVLLPGSAVRTASMRITVPAIWLVKKMRRTTTTSGKRRRPSALTGLAVTVTDLLSHRTAFFVP